MGRPRGTAVWLRLGLHPLSAAHSTSLSLPHSKESLRQLEPGTHTVLVPK
jgi:hypothetical protein